MLTINPSVYTCNIHVAFKHELTISKSFKWRAIYHKHTINLDIGDSAGNFDVSFRFHKKL